MSSGDLPKIPQPTIGYTTEAAAAVLGVATRTLRRAIAEGRAKAIRIPLAKLIEPPELQRLIAEGHRIRDVVPGPRTHGPDGRFKGSPP